MPPIDGPTVAARNHTALDDILKLANVPRPRVVLHRVESALFDLADALSHTARKASREVVDQNRDIVLALAQRWDMHRENVQPVVKVHTKPAFGHLPLKITVCRSNHTNIRLYCFPTADPLKLLLLKHPKKRDLHFRG